MSRIRAAAAVGLLAVVPCGVAQVAQATASPQHCWMDLVTGAGACDETFAQVVADVSDGEVSVLPGAETLTDQQRASIIASPNASYVLGVVYDNANYGGASFMFTGSNDCDSNSDVDWQVGSMPYGWNDRVSSFKSFGQCATRIWENNNFTGASYGYHVNSSYVGAAMNDRASSIQWN